MQKKGFLIVIDGTDGSGKKTQTQLLKDHLIDMNYPVEVLDFPQYGKKSAGPAEEYLQGKYGDAGEVTPYQASILYAVDRFDGSFEIRKWLKEGKVVLLDRYVSANMGHQAGKIADLEARDEFLSWLDHLEYEILGIPRPDLQLFLSTDPEKSRMRALASSRPGMDKSKDVHEIDGTHMQQASEAFHDVAKKYAWTQIDCEGVE